MVPSHQCAAAALLAVPEERCHLLHKSGLGPHSAGAAWDLSRAQPTVLPPSQGRVPSSAPTASIRPQGALLPADSRALPAIRLAGGAARQQMLPGEGCVQLCAGTGVTTTHSRNAQARVRTSAGAMKDGVAQLKGLDEGHPKTLLLLSWSPAPSSHLVAIPPRSQYQELLDSKHHLPFTKQGPSQEW